MNGYLNIALHDVHAGNLDTARKILADLDEAGLTPVDLLVVTHYESRHHLRGNSELTRFLKDRSSLGDEIVFHGATHRNEHRVPAKKFFRFMHDKILSRGCAEFIMTGAFTERLVAFGIEELRGMGLRVEGAVAPGWLATPEFFRACRETGLSFTTTLFFLHDLKCGEKLFSPVLTTLNSGSDSEYRNLRVLYGAAWPMMKSLALRRVAIHPNDALHRGYSEMLGCLARWKKERTLSTLGALVGRQTVSEGQALKWKII